MSTDLSLIQAVTNVGQSIMSMAASAASVRSTRKQEAAILAERIRYLKSVCRARGVAELCRYSIAEMEKTLRDIKEKIILE